MTVNKINVTKTFLPPREEFNKYLNQIWSTHYLTNNGPLLKEFENNIKNYLGVDNFQFLANGTLALQLALYGLDINGGEVITTPFSYVATTSAILWQRCKPVYVDIDQDTLCIDPKKIEEAITGNTKAILAVHVFGNPCDIEAIEDIAYRYKLKVIYDGAHAFGTKYKGKSLLDYGDVSIASFHATKLFHTIEGGGIFTKDKEVDRRVDLAKRFGHNGDVHIQLGINAKANEIQASMGLSNLNHIDEIINDRYRARRLYDDNLGSKFERQKIRSNTEYNNSYYPIIFDREEDLLKSMDLLKNNKIIARRYFYPSLNTLPYIDTNTECPVSEDISRRILCLPMYFDIKEEDIINICKLLKK